MSGRALRSNNRIELTAPRAAPHTVRWTVNTVDNSERPMVGESSCALWPFRGGWRDD